MEIRPYNPLTDFDPLMDVIRSEGEEWSCYSSGPALEKYKASLEASITYVAYEGDRLCGYSRSLDDTGFYIYVCDLLVHKECRGRSIGRQLMECLMDDYPDQTVYVMSDVDEYYKKLGFPREGSVFEVTRQPAGKG